MRHRDLTAHKNAPPNEGAFPFLFSVSHRRALFTAVHEKCSWQTLTLGAAFAGRGVYFFSHAGRILRKNSAV